MKEAMQAIRDRRSCRAYKSEQITEAELQTVLQAAILAPSARNLQQRHISVVQNKELLEELNAQIMPLLGERPNGYHVFHRAPTVLVLSADKTARWGKEDIGILSENICIAAESIGLGTCLLGLPQVLLETPDGADWLPRLKVPEGYLPVLLVSLGYKAVEDIPAKPRNQQVISYIR